MPELKWDQVGTKLYETGVEKGVLFPYKDGEYQTGVAWNGLISVSENPSGGEITPLYADNIKYLNLVSNEEFGVTIEAYTYPEEFAECDGSSSLTEGLVVGQQRRIPFGLAYITKIGNDSDGIDHGYKLHIIYNAIASPSEKAYSTINDSPEAITFSWEVSTTPIPVEPAFVVGGWKIKPTSCIVIDSSKVDEGALQTLEEMLYGVDGTDPVTDPGSDPTLPMPSDIIEIFGLTSEE